jgi:hypothetical protein
MSEYEHAIVVDAPRDTIFDTLMDFANLPRVVSVVRTAAAEPEGLVRIQASVLGRDYAIDAFIRVVDVFRRIEWAFGGDPSCTGWVQIDGDDDAPAGQVTAHVSVSPNSTPSLSRGRVDALIRDVVIASLASLRRVVDDQIPTEPE